MKFWHLSIFENLSRKLQVSLKSDKNNTYFIRQTSTLREDRYTFLIISHSLILGMKILSDKTCRENQNTHFLFSNFFLENRTVYEILFKIIIESSRAQMTIERMRIAC